LRDKKHEEYQVKLQHLIGGIGGNVQTQTLYFCYNTTFHEFLNALRDATQLCTIPPKDVNEEVYLKFHEPVADNIEDEEAGNTPGSQSSATLSARSSSQVDCPSSQDGVSKSSSRLVREQKGYLLSDGSWVYKRQRLYFCDGKQLRTTANQPSHIFNERDYWEMVKLLKKANSAKEVAKPPESEVNISNRSGSRTLPSDKVDLHAPEYDHRYTHALWIMHVSIFLS
jgi:hypothetical protein